MYSPTAPSAEDRSLTPEGLSHATPVRRNSGLPKGGLQGDTPLPWRALGHYERGLRSLLLRLRETPDNQRLKSLIALLKLTLTFQPCDLLVPIPSWKKRRQNPLPERLVDGLGVASANLLERRFAGTSQHRLNRLRRLRQPRRELPTDPPAFCRTHPLACRRHPDHWSDGTGSSKRTAGEWFARQGSDLSGPHPAASESRTPSATGGDLR